MINWTAPMQPNTARTENQVAIAKLRSCIERRHLASLGIHPTFKYTTEGKTKSGGVNPIAPQMDTKSPKKGTAAGNKSNKSHVNGSENKSDKVFSQGGNGQ